MRPLDDLIIGLYLLIAFGIGLRFFKRQANSTEYFVGHAAIPAWAVGISLMATLISSVTFLAYPGQGFAGNWILLVQGLMVPIVMVGLLWFIVPCYRRFIRVSAYEYFERRFGYGARLYSSLAFLCAHFSKMGSVVFLMAAAVAAISGLNLYAVIVLVGVIATTVALLGGIEAIIWAEVAQGTILMLGGIACALLLLFKPTGNAMDVLHLAIQHQKMSLGPFDFTFAKITFWVMAANGIFYAIQKYGTDQTVVQRFLAAKSDRDGIRAAMIGIFLCVPLWTLFMFIGTGLWAFYQLTPNALPPSIKPDEVFPHFIATQLPTGIMGLVMAALICATLSSLQSDLNCLSAVCVEDYYRRLFPSSPDRQRLFVGKTIVALAGIAAIAMACFCAQYGEKNMLAFIFDLYAIFSGGIAGLFALAFFTTRANRQGLYFGILACIAFTAWTFATSHTIHSHLMLDLGRFNFTQPQLMVGVYSHVVLFVVGYLASLFFKSDPNIRGMTIYGWLEPLNVPASPTTTPQTQYNTTQTAPADGAENIASENKC